MKLKYFLILGILFLIPIVLAQTSLTPVKLDSCVNLLQTISNATMCNVTLFYPNQTIGLNNVQMTKVGDIYNYSFCSNLVAGTYIYITQCNTNGNLDNPIPVDYIVNGYGSDVSTSQILGYGIVLLIISLIFIGTIYGAFKIPFKNNRDEEGTVISINDLKYLKIVLWVFAYLELLFMVSIARNMALGFLLSDGIYAFMNILYTIMLIALLPFFPLLIFFTIVLWLNDKKTQKALIRGIPMK
jgi:cbb3-type cytochrome oxidase subunit 3